MKKSMLGKILDGALMAPHHAMNHNGDDPHASLVTNFVHQPHIKIAGLITGAFMIVAATDKGPDPLKSPIGVLIGAGAYEVLRRRRPNVSKSFFFHTAPPPESPQTTPAAQTTCERDKKFYGPLTLAFGTGFSIVAGKYGFEPLMSTFTACYMTDMFAHYWRANQVLKGEWTATTAPPRKRVPEQEPEMKLAWAYRPV